jgi:hypothetical protein
VIEVTFPERQIRAFIEVELEACQGVPSSEETACKLMNQQKLHSMIYVQDQPDCHIDPNAVEGKRTLELGDPNDRYFVVLANADLYFPHGYYVFAEGSFAP